MTRVYAGNLSWSVTDTDLHDFMTEAGEVKSAEVIKYPDGRSKGWGLVEFVTPTSAATAINSLSDRELMERKIFIREDREVDGEGGAAPGRGRGVGTIGEPGRGKGRGRGRGRGRGPVMEEPEEVVVGGTALYVGNLPWSTTWQQLKEIFQEYNVKYADVKTGFDGRSRGYGIVRFDSETDAYAALVLNGYQLDGREILVRFDKQQRPEAE
uniref:RRM domain-containing protein n=1 Tax=Haptolina ericina TaxID=156174 RepID=A0A7S3FLX7_9EUKA|mmetsp:Transcript_73237/g.162636  ORF Transcript_73237/g.162636 Transcript_73237/m.162636 type:complete len:211 (+) Transcript_73237:43-675(+)